MEPDAARILVVHDVEETRDSLERLLRKDAYRVDAVRNEEEAIAWATRAPPSLILVSLHGSASAVIRAASRIRDQAGLKEEVPLVIFGSDIGEEGAELELERRIFVIRPDSFDQLRRFLARLLAGPPMPAL